MGWSLFFSKIMNTTPTTAMPVQLDFRAELHQIIDQIQDEAVLRAAVLLLSRFVVAKETEIPIKPAS
jgi:hypothetical protein